MYFQLHLKILIKQKSLLTLKHYKYSSTVLFFQAEEHYEKEVSVDPIAEVATEEEEVVISLDELAITENKEEGNEEDNKAAMIDTAVHDETHEEDDQN